MWTQQMFQDDSGAFATTARALDDLGAAAEVVIDAGGELAYSSDVQPGETGRADDLPGEENTRS